MKKKFIVSKEAAEAAGGYIYGDGRIFIHLAVRSRVGTIHRYSMGFKEGAEPIGQYLKSDCNSRMGCQVIAAAYKWDEIKTLISCEKCNPSLIQQKEN